MNRSGIQASFHLLILILQHSIFKSRLYAARACVFSRARALPQADARVLPDYARHAAGLAEAHPVLFLQSAVVARGKLAREIDVALGVFFLACAHRLFRKRQEYADSLVDYFANAYLLRHDGSLHWRLIKTRVREEEEKVGPTRSPDATHLANCCAEHNMSANCEAIWRNISGPDEIVGDSSRQIFAPAQNLSNS